MVFKASKIRSLKPLDRVGRGTPLVPSFAIQLAYRREVNKLTAAMIADYKAEISEVLQQKQVKRYFATDSAADAFVFLLKRLQKRWSKVFESFADKISKKFVADVDKHATSSTFASLKVSGLKEPKATYNEYVKNTLTSAEEYNKTLVVDVGAEVHEKIYNAVMLSLTSPSPQEQGVSGIENALRQVGVFSKKRVKLIAADQNSKLYTALSDERMIQNGVEEFEWMHSGGGKYPRHSHELMDGHRFKINDPRLWKVGGEFKLKRGDLGPPGWAIHCRCRKRPII